MIFELIEQIPVAGEKLPVEGGELVRGGVAGHVGLNKGAVFLIGGDQEHVGDHGLAVEDPFHEALPGFFNDVFAGHIIGGWRAFCGQLWRRRRDPHR